MNVIYCSECGKPIKAKRDLKVAGKLLQPYHASCLNNAKSSIGKVHKFYGCFPLGVFFWIWLILGNIFAGFVIKITPESTGVLILFLIIANTVYIGTRIGIFYSYEKKIG